MKRAQERETAVERRREVTIMFEFFWAWMRTEFLFPRVGDIYHLRIFVSWAFDGA